MQQAATLQQQQQQHQQQFQTVQVNQNSIQQQVEAVHVQQMTAQDATPAATYPTVQVPQSAEVDLTSQNIQSVAVVQPVIDNQQSMQTLVSATPMPVQSQNLLQQHVVAHEIPSQLPMQQVHYTLFILSCQ